ncbi:FIG00602532: hypothetical protein [Olavius algarvensis associated proteobacterium Delta 3]|nr:FIG00602532: hypothetical protein [Olavius algarvensis associated proteobacterium Delta 3]CAB5126074.1 FIG00602532: hypothetical protein [Olavius algarvensis associated proteobacterium Delta 3]
MSTTEEHANEVPAEIADKKETTPETKKESAIGYVILFFFVGLIASLIVGWIIFPRLLYSQKSQPFDFNHAVHLDLVDEGCQSCHYFREDGSFSGVPKLAQCIDCHEEVNGEDPNEEIFVTEYVWKEREVPWLIYSKQPDCVFFSHVAHVSEDSLYDGKDCVTCHGYHGESETLRPYQYNRITNISRDIWGHNIAGFARNSWDRAKMDDCAKCHAEARDAASRRNLKAPTTRFITNIIDVAFPGTRPAGKGSSVQTERGACFECHK